MTHLVKNPERFAFMRREALRVAGPSPEFLGYIRRNDLRLETCIAHAGYFSVALVKFLGRNSGEECFFFDVDGEPAAIIEALLFDRQREQVCADLVAWPIDAPELFATAMGINDGADVLGPQNMVQRNGQPLLIHRTPLAWLQAGCTGCVLLKPGARHWLRRAGGPFIVEDVEHGQEVRNLLDSVGLSHRILVKTHTIRSAA